MGIKWRPWASGFDHTSQMITGFSNFDDKFDLYQKKPLAFQKLCDYVENFKCKDSDGDTWADVYQTSHKLIRSGSLVCFIKISRLA